MLHERARLLNIHGGSTARYVYLLATIDVVVVVIGPEVEFTDQINAIGIVDGRIWVVAAGAVHTATSPNGSAARTASGSSPCSSCRAWCR